MLTEAEKSMCRLLGMSEALFGLGKADNRPSEAADGDEGADAGQRLNAAALAVLTPEELAMCRRLHMQPRTYLMGKLSPADYQAVANAAGAGNAVAAAMQAVRTGLRVATQTVYNTVAEPLRGVQLPDGACLGPSLPLF